MNEIENKLFYIATARAKITAQFPVRCQKKTFYCFNNIEYLLLCIPISYTFTQISNLKKEKTLVSYLKRELHHFYDKLNE